MKVMVVIAKIQNDPIELRIVYQWLLIQKLEKLLMNLEL